MTKNRRSFFILASSSVLVLALGAGPVFANGCGLFDHHGGGCPGGGECTSGGFIKLHRACGRSGGYATPTTSSPSYYSTTPMSYGTPSTMTPGTPAMTPNRPPRSPMNPNIPASGSELNR